MKKCFACFPLTQFSSIFKLSRCRKWELCIFRIIELFELEESWAGHAVQFPCNEQKHLKLKQFAWSPVQNGLGYQLRIYCLINLSCFLSKYFPIKKVVQIRIFLLTHKNCDVSKVYYFCLVAFSLILSAYDRQNILCYHDSAERSGFGVHKGVVTLLSLN